MRIKKTVSGYSITAVELAEGRLRESSRSSEKSRWDDQYIPDDIFDEIWRRIGKEYRRRLAERRGAEVHEQGNPDRHERGWEFSEAEMGPGARR